MRRTPCCTSCTGGGDDERGWYHDGRAAVVLDTLIGLGAIRSLVVAMPYGQLTPLPGDAGAPAPAPSAHPIDGATPAAPAVPTAPNPREGDYFLEEVAGMVEGRYGVRRPRRARFGRALDGGRAVVTPDGQPPWPGRRRGWVLGCPAGGGGGRGSEPGLPARALAAALAVPVTGSSREPTPGPQLRPPGGHGEEIAPSLPGLTLHADIKRGGHEWQVWIRCLAEFLHLWQPA